MALDLPGILVGALAGGLGGYASALFTFKLKVAMLERDLKDHRREVTIGMESHTRLLNQIDRRQLVTLEMMTEITGAMADKLGIQSKTGSMLLKFMQETGE